MYLYAEVIVILMFMVSPELWVEASQATWTLSTQKLHYLLTSESRPSPKRGEAELHPISAQSENLTVGAQYWLDPDWSYAIQFLSQTCKTSDDQSDRHAIPFPSKARNYESEAISHNLCIQKEKGTLKNKHSVASVMLQTVLESFCSLFGSNIPCSACNYSQYCWCPATT